MGEYEQAAKDLVDRANAGDEVAWATLHLVGENARNGKPFRACIVYELAMRYAKSKTDIGHDWLVSKKDIPMNAHQWLWRRAATGVAGDRPDLFGYLKGCEYGKEACVTAFAMGPKLTDKRLNSILSSFKGDPIGAKLAEKGLDDPELRSLSAFTEQAGKEGESIVEACYFLGACLMNARIRQCIVSGNFTPCRSLCIELGEPTSREIAR
jgi:hypothetical protein